MSKWVRILAAEDDELVWTALQRSLKQCGFQVCPAEDGPAEPELEKGERAGTSLIRLDDVSDELAEGTPRA